MTDELRGKVTSYRTVMSIAKEMVSSGIITDEDYSQIDAEMTEKYGLNSNTIFR